MKKSYPLLLCLIWLMCHTRAQSIDTLLILQESHKAPRSVRYHPVSLAQYLTSKYADDTSKVIAISSWIAHHIRYDYKAFAKRDIPHWTSEQVLRKRKGVCQHYAQLFADMCQAVGIQAEVVEGYTRKFDLFPMDHLYRTDHAWPMVKLGGKWHLMEMTWASGCLLPRKQKIAKLLWRFFKKPYQEKRKYVAQLDQQWLFVPPEQMILTHFPIVNEFQLLDKPVPIDSFIAGEGAVKRFLVKSNAQAFHSPFLNRFLSLDYISKQLEEAEKSQQSNPFNHRRLALNYENAARFREMKLKEREANGLEINATEKEALLQLQRKADVAYAQTIKDYRTEFLVKTERSNDWLANMRKRNQRAKDDIRTRIKENEKQIRLIAKTQKQRKAHQQLGVNGLKRWDKYAMRHIKRPRQASLNRPDAHLESLSKAYDYEQAGLLMIQRKDSFLRYPMDTERNRAMDLEDQVHALYRHAIFHMDSLLASHNSRFRLIHKNGDRIEKKEVFAAFEQGHQLNQSATQPYLEQMAHNPQAAYKSMTAFNRSQSQRMRYIFQTKKLSMKDIGEDQLYNEARLAYEEACKTYLGQISSYYRSHREIRKNLITERQTLQKLTKMLAADTHIEKIRHRRYRRYRLFVQQQETRILWNMLK